MSREQDQRLVDAYEKVVKGESPLDEMKTVSSKELMKAYNELFGGSSDKEAERIHGNWLDRLKKSPESALAVGKKTWAGKNTTALFKALGIKQPKKKPEMVKVLNESIGMVIGTPLSRRHEATPTQEGRMKDLAFDLFEEIKDMAEKVKALADKVKKVHKPAAMGLRMAYHEIKQAGKKLPVEEDTVSEGFANNVGSGKVPIGVFAFEYIPAKRKDIQFLINSMKHRDPEEIIKLKNSVVMRAYPRAHQSLITSLQRLNFNGEVVDYYHKEKGVVVYQKEGK